MHDGTTACSVTLSEEVEHFSAADITVQGSARVVASALSHAQVANFRPSNDKSLTYAFDLELTADGTATLLVEDEVFADLCGNPNVRSNVITVTQGGFAPPR